MPDQAEQLPLIKGSFRLACNIGCPQPPHTLWQPATLIECLL